jgi:hypothetical protein
MAERKVVRHFNWLDIEPDKKLDATTGWVKMDVRWSLCPRRVENWVQRPST